MTQLIYGSTDRRQTVRFATHGMPIRFTAFELSTAAVSALLEEAELTPKPALVDRRGNGAHHDLDLARLRRSAQSLREGFVDIAQAAAALEPSLVLHEQIGQIGRDMEQRMLMATDGSNAHRGAIWALGLLVAAAAQHGTEGSAAGIAAVAAALARLPDRFAPRPLSNGARVRLRFGATGARGEAQAAFPHALEIGLPALRAARGRGVPEDCARLDALMAIMACLDDTCLLHRGGHAALKTAKTGANAVLAAGGTATSAGLKRLHLLHDELMALWASPGGSADLLGVTLFLDRLEEGIRDEGRNKTSWSLLTPNILQKRSPVMETLQYEYETKGPLTRRAHVGVVGSGDLEVLIEPSDKATAQVRVRTSVDGYAQVWKAVLDRFFARFDRAANVEINDFGATPGTVTLRLEQAAEEVQS